MVFFSWGIEHTSSSVGKLGEVFSSNSRLSFSPSLLLPLRSCPSPSGFGLVDDDDKSVSNGEMSSFRRAVYHQAGRALPACLEY